MKVWMKESFRESLRRHRLVRIGLYARRSILWALLAAIGAACIYLGARKLVLPGWWPGFAVGIVLGGAAVVLPRGSIRRRLSNPARRDIFNVWLVATVVIPLLFVNRILPNYSSEDVLKVIILSAGITVLLILITLAFLLMTALGSDDAIFP